jgi:polyhydroxyalkanoate synthesis regulator phasin
VVDSRVRAMYEVANVLSSGKFNQEEIKQKIKDELKNSLSNMKNEEQEQLQTIGNKIQSLFDIYSSTVDDLNNDVVALENSLNNLIEQKKTRKIDCESAKKSLNDFVNNISSQRDKIEADFREYLQVKN